MLNNLRPALSMIVLFTALLGLAYPLAVTGVAGILLPDRAQGSLVERNGTAVGSALVGQSFTSDRYFHGRPSATAEKPYNAASSGGTSLGPTSARLRDMIATEAGKLRAAGDATPLPADAVTSSGSGLDPDISPAFARLQIARVARARDMPAQRLAALVDAQTEKPLLGFLGETRINVLKLNMALDKAVLQK